MKLLTGLLPVAAAGALAALGPMIWPPLQSLRVAIALAGGAAVFLAYGQIAASVRWRALLAVAGWITLAVATCASVWPIGEQGLALVEHRKVAMVNAPGIAIVIGALDDLSSLLSRYWQWSLTLLGFGTACGATLYMLVPFTWREIKSALGITRVQSDGPWRGGWMAAGEALQLAANPVGLPLGRWHGKLLRYRPKPGWQAGHHAVIAGTRGGKGVSCILPAALDHDGPIVAIDVKGEIFATCSRYRSQWRRQIALNPYHIVEPQTATYEPLSYARLESLERDVAVLVEGLIKPEPRDVWISNAAADLLRAAIELVITVAPPEERTLKQVVDIVLGPTRLDTFQAWTDRGDLADGRIARAAANVLSMGDRQRGAVLDSLRQNLAWVENSSMRRMMARSEFHFDELLDGEADVYLMVPHDALGPMSGFLRLVMTLAMGAITRQDGYRAVRAPILAILDEFTRLGRMERVLDIATVAAGAGVEAIFVVQDRGTLDDTYGAAGAGTILGSCATVRAFSLGRADERTAQWVASLLPKRTVRTQSRTERKLTHGETASPLMEAAEILQLPPDELLCLIRSHAPLKLKRIISHEDRAYRAKLAPNPIVRM